MAENVSGKKVAITREQMVEAMKQYPGYNRYQLAELLGCSEQTIDRRLHGNNIRGGKYSSQTRVKLVGGRAAHDPRRAQGGIISPCFVGCLSGKTSACSSWPSTCSSSAPSSSPRSSSTPWPACACGALETDASLRNARNTVAELSLTPEVLAGDIAASPLCLPP